MPLHDDSTAGLAGTAGTASSAAERVGRLLDAARSSALSDALADADSDPPPDRYWPSTWPPGRDQGPDEVPSAGQAGRLSGTLPIGPRLEVSSRAAACVGALALLIIGALLVLHLRGPAAGTVVPARDPVPFTGVATAAALLSQTTSAGVGADAVGRSPEVGVLPGGTALPSLGGLRVYVVGQVRHPGVVSLSDGARVEDAVDAAGGATGRADLAAMNLARKLIDGERLVVPRPGQKIPTDEPGPAAAAGSPVPAGTGSAPAGPVDLNTATVADLDALPGVGPVIAGRIVAWRQQNGSFKTVDDLGEVSGIGDATMARLRPLVRV